MRKSTRQFLERYEPYCEQGRGKERSCLVVEPAGRLYGSERALLDFLAVIPKDRWDVSVCCPSDGGFRDRADGMGLTVYPTWPEDTHAGTIFRRFLALVGLVRICTRVDPDIIHVNQAGASRVAGLAGWFTGIPVVSHVRLSGDVEYVRAISARPYAPCAFIAVSRHVAKQMEDLSSVTTVYDPYHLSREVVPSVSCTEKSAPIFVCLGRVEPRKGQDLAVAATQLFYSRTEREPSLKILGGPGNDRDFVSALKRQVKSSRIEFLGFRPDVMPFLENSTALICPSWGESLGRVVLEAWDAGTVPIAWRGSGGPAEIIEDSGGGVLYAEQNPGCLAQAMERTANLSMGRRAKLIGRGRAWIRQHCAPTSHAKKVLGVWSEVLGA